MAGGKGGRWDRGKQKGRRDRATDLLLEWGRVCSLKGNGRVVDLHKDLSLCCAVLHLPSFAKAAPPVTFLLALSTSFHEGWFEQKKNRNRMLRNVGYVLPGCLWLHIQTSSAE